MKDNEFFNLNNEDIENILSDHKDLLLQFVSAFNFEKGMLSLSCNKGNEIEIQNTDKDCQQNFGLDIENDTENLQNPSYVMNPIPVDNPNASATSQRGTISFLHRFFEFQCIFHV